MISLIAGFVIGASILGPAAALTYYIVDNR
jgi:hypothetical protein